VRAFHRETSSLDLIRDLDVEHVTGDVTQPQTLAEAFRGVDVVFHAASKVDYWRGSNGMYPITVGGTRNVFLAALDAGVQRVVYTSSVASLGVPDLAGIAGNPSDLPPPLMDETHSWNYKPRWWRYGHAKHLAEKEAQMAVGRGLDVVIVNPSMVLGPGDAHRISGEIVIQVARGIVRFGIPGGMNAIHVDDVTRGHLLALERGRTGERYILGGENNTYLGFIQAASRVARVRPPRCSLPIWMLRPLASPLDLLCQLLPMPFNGDLLRFAGRYLYYDTQKARQTLGFQAEKSVEEALRETYVWYLSRGMVPLPRHVG